MSDQGVREIQLSGKQLVFLFMATVVLAVGIFLLGVSVGRGVRGATGAPATAVETQRADNEPAGPMPPAVTPEPQDLRYHDQLQGQASTAAAPTTTSEKPAANATPPDVEPVDEPQGKDAAAAAASSAKSDKAASKETPATPAKAPAAVPDTSTGWTVQVNAFRSRDNANKQVAQLKGQGLPAFIFTVEGAPSALFAVRVGPYPQRADAERAAARLRGQFPGARIQR